MKPEKQEQKNLAKDPEKTSRQEKEPERNSRQEKNYLVLAFLFFC